MKFSKKAACILALALAPGVSAQVAMISQHVEVVGVSSGTFNGAGQSETLAWEHLVRSDGAPWMRLRFGDSRLGRGSYVTVTSILDGETHRLDGAEMKKWAGRSAFLNGDAVLVRLHVDPNDVDVFVDLAEAIVGDPGSGAATETICGTVDNRTSSSNNRTGRLLTSRGSCTAWRSVNGAMVTAGHCADLDPDGPGPLLPDGNHDLTGAVVEFNVPPSTGSGSLVNPPVDDQFPFSSTIAPRFRFDGEGTGLGKDWAVFGVSANASGQLPHERYGLPFRSTRESPAGSDDVRVTGCGTDARPPGTTGGRNSSNLTLQTDVGGYNGENSGGGGIWINYRVDTQGGNSGSPVLWFQGEQLTIGIHTDGGCSLLPLTNNHGTSCEVNGLESALHTWLDSAVEFADVGHPLPVSESGQIYRPWGTVSDAVANVAAGGTVAVVEGTYYESAGNVFTTNKAMTIVAPCGVVVIGE